MNLSGTGRTYLNRLCEVLNRVDTDEIDRAIELIHKTWMEGHQIVTCGNGGSALTALHYLTDWNKMVFLSSGKPFRGRCLADNVGLITAYANDVSYQDIFIEQLKPILQPGDLVIGISGSGNSENVLRAIEYANKHQGVTLGICGFSGGKLRQIAGHSICSSVHDMQLSEDLHQIFGHIVMQTLCSNRSSEKGVESAMSQTNSLKKDVKGSKRHPASAIRS
jgi:D-sedoheptulose 7-phosphate isomerase